MRCSAPENSGNSRPEASDQTASRISSQKCLQPLLDKRRQLSITERFKTARERTGQPLLGKQLAFAHVQLSAPVEHLAEIQQYQRIRVVHQLDFPGLDGAYSDADFLMKLAAQGPLALHSNWATLHCPQLHAFSSVDRFMSDRVVHTVPQGCLICIRLISAAQFSMAPLRYI